MTDDNVIQQERLEFCKQCENFSFNENQITYCKETGCLINLMISDECKPCPKGNW